MKLSFKLFIINKKNPQKCFLIEYMNRFRILVGSPLFSDNIFFVSNFLLKSGKHALYCCFDVAVCLKKSLDINLSVGEPHFV